MRTVQPVEFKKAFMETMEPAKSMLLKKWHGRLGEFTALMRTYFQRIAPKLQLEIYNGDYYTLDAVFYETKDTKHFDQTTTYVHYIAIALEHENNIVGAYTEMNKLQLFNSPLKVLITYASKSEHDAYLEEYSEMIKSADVFEDFSTHKKQLVVFGDEVDGQVSWYFYQFVDGKFSEI